MFAFLLNAQVDTTDNKIGEDVLDNVIEDAIIDVESDEQTDWTMFTDALETYKKNPLNLNTASSEELLLVPGMNELLIANLQGHIQKFDKLTSLYELQAIPGFDFEVFQTIKAFVTVEEVSENDIQERPKHPKGPSLNKILTGSKHELILRATTLLEEQKGYTPPDTNSDGSLTSRYAGNPWRYYTRYRMRYGRNFSAAIVAEKDPGEQFQWDPAKNFYGFDYLAGHIFLRDFGHLKRLVVGDYSLQAGQGLVLSTGLGFGKGAQSVNAIKRSNIGIRPYSSVNENQNMRGAAAQVAFGDIYVTGYYSRVGLDANITDFDTLTNEVNVVSTLQTNGLHRTESEIADKDALLETQYGARVEYKRPRLTLGTTHVIQQFDGELAPSDRDYQFYNFSGDLNFINGLDFDWTVRNLNFFGEFARSKSGGTALSTGVMASLSRKFDVGMQFRNFTPDFHTTPRAFAFAERPQAVANERGMYLGVQFFPTTKWTIAAYLDQFKFPWHRFNVSYPSRGVEYFVEVMYRPSRNLNVKVRYKSDNKQQNASDTYEGQQLDFLVPTQRQNFRIQYEQKFHRTVRVRTRFEHSWYTRGQEENVKGMLIYQDLSWEVSQKVKLTARYAIFDIPDYDARIYAYENDVLGYFSIPPYSGKGTRYYAMVQFSPVRNLDFWFRFARTRLPGDRTQSSGLTEIQGDSRSEIKLQARLSF